MKKSGVAGGDPVEKDSNRRTILVVSDRIVGKSRQGWSAMLLCTGLFVNRAGNMVPVQMDWRCAAAPSGAGVFWWICTTTSGANGAVCLKTPEVGPGEEKTVPVAAKIGSSLLCPLFGYRRWIVVDRRQEKMDRDGLVWILLLLHQEEHNVPVPVNKSERSVHLGRRRK